MRLVANVQFGFFFSASGVHRRSDTQQPIERCMRFVTVEDGVRLEVLDWGGSGRPVVLLAGLGFTAHGYCPFLWDPILLGNTTIDALDRWPTAVSSANRETTD